MKTAADFGLPFIEREKVYNSRLAQELRFWAESQNKGDLYHDAVFRAYFGEGKNITKIPILADLVASLGLSREKAKEVLKTRAFKDEVDSDWAVSYKKAIKAIPTFVINQEMLVGAQPYKKMKEFMKRNGLRNVMEK